MMSQTVLAVIVGNRDFFPDRLVTEGRQDILALLKEMNIEPVILGEKDTNLGGVETWQTRRSAELFKAHADRIDGIRDVANLGTRRASPRRSSCPA
jgi:L-fucose isomerase-like protein